MLRALKSPAPLRIVRNEHTSGSQGNEPIALTAETATFGPSLVTSEPGCHNPGAPDAQRPTCTPHTGAGRLRLSQSPCHNFDLRTSLG